MGGWFSRRGAEAQREETNAEFEMGNWECGDKDLGLGEELDSGFAGEVGVLGPEGGVGAFCSGVDDRVSEGEVLLGCDHGGFKGEIGSEIDDLAALHGCDREERVVFSALPGYGFEDLVEADGGDDQEFLIFNGFGEKAGVPLIGEVGEPCRRVDKVHSRSPSRSTVVSMPLR